MTTSLFPEKFVFTELLLDTLNPYGYDSFPHACDVDSNSTMCNTSKACENVGKVIAAAIASPDENTVKMATEEVKKCAAAMKEMDVKKDFPKFASEMTTDPLGQQITAGEQICKKLKALDRKLSMPAFKEFMNEMSSLSHSSAAICNGIAGEACKACSVNDTNLGVDSDLGSSLDDYIKVANDMPSPSIPAAVWVLVACIVAIFVTMVAAMFVMGLRKDAGKMELRTPRRK